MAWANSVESCAMKARQLLSVWSVLAVHGATPKALDAGALASWRTSLGEAIRDNAQTLISMLRKYGVITPQSETQWLGLDGTTGRLRIDRFSPEGSETLRLGIAGAFVGDKRVLAKSNARLRDLYERMAPVAMALDTWESEHSDTYNVTPYFRTATREVWRVASMSDDDMAAHYANESIAFEDGNDDGLETPEEVFTDANVAAALVWLREYARGSRVAGARRLLEYWRAIPLELRDPSVNVMFPAEAPSPERLREDVLGMACTARIARMGVREYLGGGARLSNPLTGALVMTHPDDDASQEDGPARWTLPSSPLSDEEKWALAKERSRLAAKYRKDTGGGTPYDELQEEIDRMKREVWGGKS